MMPMTLSGRLREFLLKRRILGVVAQKMGKKPSTLPSELNPKVPNAKFGLDDLSPLCAAVHELGYGSELRGLLHEYFEELANPADEATADDELLPIVASLMAKTAALADHASHLVEDTDEAELKQIEQMIRSELLPTALKLGVMIDQRLGKRNKGPESDTGTEPVAN